MPPRFTCQNQRYRWPADAIFTSKGVMRDPSHGVSFPDGCNHGFCEFGLTQSRSSRETFRVARGPTVFSARNQFRVFSRPVRLAALAVDVTWPAPSSLVKHVVRIVRVRAKLEMARIDASRVVAFVHRNPAAGLLGTRKEQGNHVRSIRGPVSDDPDRAVSSSVYWAVPGPAVSKGWRVIRDWAILIYQCLKLLPVLLIEFWDESVSHIANFLSCLVSVCPSVKHSGERANSFISGGVGQL